MYKQRKSFTLIELLVVIAIIAILASMLLPAISKARDQAKTIACSNNIRQISAEFAMYGDEYNQYYPVGGYGPNPWSYLIYGDAKMSSAKYKALEHTYCPSNKFRDSGDNYYNTYGIKGNKWDDAYESFHGCNGNPYIGTLTSPNVLVINTKRISAPSRYFFIADSMRSNGKNVYYIDKYTTFGIGVMHSNQAKMGYVDGHVAGVSLAELKEMAIQGGCASGFIRNYDNSVLH